MREKRTDELYAMKGNRAITPDCDFTDPRAPVLSKREMIQRKKIKRALTEQDILATANHPFIVTLYDS